MYLAIFVVCLVLAHFPPLAWVLHGLALLGFLVLYFRGFWLKGPALLPIIGAITLIGVAFIPWNPGASVFFVYAAAFVADVGRPAVAARYLGALLLLVVVETVAAHLPLEAWVPAAVFTLIIGGGNIGFVEKSRADARLRLARDELDHLAKVAERERIARDLHDLLGHTLSVIVLKSELAAKLTDRDPARAGNEIRDVERISREALGEVRRAVQGYRELTLDESLARARQALLAAGVALETDVVPVRLAPSTEGVVSLLLREAVTNVIRHARATRCDICMRGQSGWLYLLVKDNGIGGTPRGGSGVTGMRVRVEELGGRFEYDGGEGTTIRVDLPLGTPAPGTTPPVSSEDLKPERRS